MNKQSVADLVHEVKAKTQTVALCAPSFEAALNSTTTTGITAGFRPSYTQRELPTESGKEVGKGGFVWLSNNVLSLVERLPKKCRPSVRSVLLAYAQLSSRRGNARTFPAAAELVARMAGCAIRTVHNADKHLVAAGLLSISRQRIQGRDVPRLVTLVEVAAAPPIPFEVVSVDDLPGVREHRRRQSKRSVHTGMQVVQCNLHTLKKPSEEIQNTYTPNSLSSSRRQRPPQPRGERNVWEDCEERLAKEHGVDVARVRALRELHAAGLAKLSSGAYQTVTNFTNAFPSLMAKHKPKESRIARYRGCGDPSQYDDRPVDPVRSNEASRRAEEDRARRYGTYRANHTTLPEDYGHATTEERRQFMESNEGAEFLAMAESYGCDGKYFTVCTDTGQIKARPTTSRMGCLGDPSAY